MASPGCQYRAASCDLSWMSISVSGSRPKQAWTSSARIAATLSQTEEPAARQWTTARPGRRGRISRTAQVVGLTDDRRVTGAFVVADPMIRLFACVDRLGSLGGVLFQLGGRGEDGMRPPLVLEAERASLLLCEGGEGRAGERPDEKQGQRERKSDHENYHVQRATNRSSPSWYGHVA